MSDGPFKSPKLKRHWRGFAEISCSAAFTQSEKQEAGKRALKLELEKFPLRKIFEAIRGEEQGTLRFGEPDSRIEELKNSLLRSSPCATTVAIEECGTEAILDGRSGEDAVRTTVKNVLESVLESAVSSLKELAQREANDQSIRANCQSLDAAAASIDIDSVVTDLMSPVKGDGKTTRIPKQSSVDQGPQLP